MEHDRDLDTFKWTLEKRTTEITEAVPTSTGAAGSLKSLSMIIKCLGETNKDVVHVLLRSKKDIGGSQQLLVLLKDYFECSHKTLEFLNTLHEWLRGGRGLCRRLNLVKKALTDFKADKTNTWCAGRVLKQALDVFTEANDSLMAGRLRAKLQAVIYEQGSLYVKLRHKYSVDENCVRRTKVYRRVTTVILASVYLGLMACVAVTAVLSPPLVVAPVAALAALAAMNPVEYTRLLMNRMWGDYEQKIRTRSELINALMGARTGITVEDLEAIRIVVRAMRDKMQGFSNVAAFVNLRRDAMVWAIVDDMENKIDVFAAAVKDLEAKKHKCFMDVTYARQQILGIVSK